MTVLKGLKLLRSLQRNYANKDDIKQYKKLAILGTRRFFFSIPNSVLILQKKNLDKEKTLYLLTRLTLIEFR